MNAAERSQRWRERRAIYRPGAEEFNPSRYGVEVIEEGAAKAFVERHHYSRSFPSARARLGLLRVRPGGGTELAGVAVFSVPPGQAVIPCWCGTAPDLGIELGRFVLLDDVEGNGETWFLKRAFGLLVAELPEVRAVLSFSDPFPRLNLRGDEVKPGHLGTIYQHFGGRYLGISKRRTIYLDNEGQVVSDRAISKLRQEDKGWRYVIENLEKAGAPRWLTGESGAAYWRRVLGSDCLRRVRHPGNHAYLWPLGDARERRQVLTAAKTPKPPPTSLPPSPGRQLSLVA
jgi:hypothetical protein